MATELENGPVPVVTETVERLSPSLVRVGLGGPGLASFAPLGVPDEAVVLRFPGSEAARWYTVRRCEPGRLTVDIVLHPGGVGGEWASRAQVGDRLEITHRNSWFRRPPEAGWQLLLGDVTALPALGRIVEESADRLPTTVLVEVPHREDAQELPGAQVRWMHTAGLGQAPSRLAELVRGAQLPPGPGYVYVAGEASATRAVRRYLRQELKLSAGSYGVVGYWRAESEKWFARVAETGADTAAIYAEELDAGGDLEDVRARYEERLATLGL
ncbi:siderophore-interacting protein [Pseudonocardia sp. RS11V-5]|uniref:siderophore-interacting protein n=1 Tax=Pseudonocardia terrae TaxID=2905831 RepID=UPI001E2B1D20|nr:siderophore-interacting protein [Pseudonocardia terrae]MCE3549931.1 siderophore-interacting protein [Pseudonocardia terrae]